MRKILLIICTLASLTTLSQPAGWLYNEPITVTNSNTVAAVDYQLKITVNTQSLISGGKMTATGSDIRFGPTCTGTVFFNHWIEGPMNTPTTAIWVKIPNIAANTFTTIYMFYGNNTVTTTSSVFGTFRGPNSSTDSVVVATVNALVANSQRGFRFSPNENMLVTHFGKREPTGTTRYVTLFNNGTQGVIAQTQVPGGAGTYTYTNLQNPIWLTANTQYVLQIFQGSNDGYYYGTSNQIGQHLTYYDMRYCNSCTQNTFPTNVLANYHYGVPDFWYFLTNTLSVVPTYSFGGANVTITGPTQLCSGNSATLITNASGTFSWNTGQTTNSIVVSPTVTTNYQVSETNTLGCNSNGYLTITVSAQAPQLSISSSTTNTCPGKPVTMTASGANSYSWTGGVTNGLPFSPNVTSTYVVTGVNGCGTSTASVQIMVNPLPVLAIASSTQVCAANPVTLTAAGAPNFTWQPNNIQSHSVVVAPQANTIYTVTGSDSICSGVYTLEIQTLANPTVQIAVSNSVICAGEVASFTASGASTYSWDPPVSTGPTATVSPSIPTAYKVYGTNSAGCTSQAQQIVLVNPSPTLQIVPSSTSICNGSSSTLQITGNGTAYTWNTGSVSPVLVVSPNTTSSYSVIASFTNACTNTAVVAISVFDAQLSVSPDVTICPGQSTNLVAGAGTNYNWSNGATVQVNVVSPTVATLYTVSATTTSNNVTCLATNSVMVDLWPEPVLLPTATHTNICRNQTTTLSVTGANTYTWTGPKNSTQASLTFSTLGVNFFTFNVSGTDDNGCVGKASIVIRVNSCVGMEEENLSGVSIFPNPASGFFTISVDRPLQAELINQQGQIVRTILLNESKHQEVSVADLAPGIYHVQWKEGEASRSFQIVVEK